MHKEVFDFQLNTRSGVPAYLQLVQQVRRAITLGRLRPNDRLPTIREVVAALVISPNTVLKAYTHLELEGLVISRAGVGTYVQPNLTVRPLQNHSSLRRRLFRWLRDARAAGLDEDAIDALMAAARLEAGDSEGVA
jgi:GntR family transcriptional regulator